MAFQLMTASCTIGPDVHLARGGAVAQSFPTRQNDPRAHGNGLCGLLGDAPALRVFPFFFRRQIELGRPMTISYAADWSFIQRISDSEH
jgi:hypothetical protein